MRFSIFFLLASGFILICSCNNDQSLPETQLVAALDQAIDQHRMGGKVILVWKNDVLCSQIDCQQKSIFSKNHEYRLANKELHFMYGSPPYLVVKTWETYPEVQVIKTGK